MRKGRNDNINNNIAIEEVCKQEQQLFLVSILPFQLYAYRMTFPSQDH
jgi:hypothetical protein